MRTSACDICGKPVTSGRRGRLRRTHPACRGPIPLPHRGPHLCSICAEPVESGRRGPIRRTHTDCRYARYRAGTPWRRTPQRTTVSCRECSSTFVEERHWARRKFCSNRCGQTFGGRQRQIVARGVPFDRAYGLAEVAIRWGWCCAICGWVVDPSLRFPHMSSGQVDHIVPVTLGGHHVLDNLQLAHRLCNQVKSARSDGETFFIAPDLAEVLAGAWPPTQTYRAEAA